MLLIYLIVNWSMCQQHTHTSCTSGFISHSTLFLSLRSAWIFDMFLTKKSLTQEQKIWMWILLQFVQPECILNYTKYMSITFHSLLLFLFLTFLCFWPPSEKFSWEKKSVKAKSTRKKDKEQVQCMFWPLLGWTHCFLLPWQSVIGGGLSRRSFPFIPFDSDLQFASLCFYCFELCTEQKGDEINRKCSSIGNWISKAINITWPNIK